MGRQGRDRRRSRRRTVAGAVVAVGAWLATTGCAALWTGDMEVDEVATWGRSEGAGNDALLEGTLTVEDGCVYVTDADGVRWLPVFSVDRVAWDGTTLVTGAGAFADGDAIGVGGGELVGSVPADWEPPDGLHVPEGCAPDAVWNGTR